MPKFLNPITITTPSGSAPLIVNSSTVVTNLNADLLDGQHGSFYQNAGNLNAGTLLAARLPAFTGGDVTSSAGSAVLTLATVATAGTYRSVTVDAKGRVTAGTNPTTLAGYAISDAMKIGGAPGVDLNTLTTSGVYRINNTEANRPNDWGQLLVMYGGSDTITQIYGHYVDGTLKTRSGNPTNVGGSGSWSPWRTLLADHNYSSYALPLTGGTITGQLSVNGSTASDILRLYTTGSTVWKLGVTDASGSYFNITADFGNFTINKSNGNVTTPGAFVSTVATGTAPLTVTSTTLVSNLNSQYLNGQLGSYYENRDTTAVGFSGGTLTLTRASGNLTTSLDGRYLLLSGGAITGNTTFSGDNHLTFGPNSTWSNSIRIGGNGYTATGTQMASVATTNGNLHLDSAKLAARGVYLNWYGGDAGTYFGNGSGGQSGRVDGSGNASFGGTVTSNYGTFSAPGHIIGDAQYGFYASAGSLFYKSASTGNHIWRNIANSADTMTLDNSGNLLLSGSLRLTDTTTGISKSGGRLSIRSESTDDVANFASYGLYLPKTGQTAGLYVESAIEARAGIRLGTSAANGTITVGADTANTANRLVQRDGSGNIAVSGIKQGADLARPLASWGVSGTSTGMVIFSFPGGSGNYGMVHCVFDIYEYNSNTVSTVIVGGHNWNGQWYNTGSNVIGRCGKTVRLGFKDGKYCVVFGGAASSWEYGTIVLRKIHNGAFYTGIMDMGGAFTTSQTATESFTWVTGDLRVLRSSAAIISDDYLRGTEVYSSNWFRNDNSGSGIYNSATSNHFYSDGPYWNVAYSGTQGIRFRNGHNGTILGYIYAETDGNFGLLSNNGGWAVQVKPGGGGNLNGTWTINSNTPLTSANYSGYALPLTGGTLTGALTINATGSVLGTAYNHSTYFGGTTAGSIRGSNEGYIVISSNSAGTSDKSIYLNSAASIQFDALSHYRFNKPSTAGYQTVALFGTAASGLFLTTDSPIISTGAYYNNGWIATAASGTLTNYVNGAYEWSTFSGATVGSAPALVSRMTLTNAGTLNVVGAITQGGNQVLHAGNFNSYAMLTTGIPSGSDQYVNFRVIRNSAAGNTDGMYIGYGNAGSGRTRIYSEGSTTSHVYPDSSGNLFRSDGAAYLHSSNYTSYTAPNAANLPYSWSNTANVSVFSGSYSYNANAAKYLLLWQRTSGATGTNGRFVDGMLKVWRGANHAGNGGTVGYVHASSGYSGQSSEVLNYTPFTGQGLTFSSVVYNSVEWIAVAMPVSDYFWEFRGNYGIQGDTTTVPILVQAGQAGVGAVTNLATGSPIITSSTYSLFSSFTGTVSGSNFSGPGTGLTGLAAGLSIGGSAAQLNGQAASYYENRDTTAVGFSGGTLTLTRAAGNLTVSLDGRYLPLTGGTLTGGLSGTSGSFSGDVTWSGYNSGNARAVRIGYSGGNYGSIGYGINYTSTTGSHTYAFNDAVTRIDLADGIQVYSAAGAAAGTTVGWTTLLNASRGNASMQWKGNNVLDASNYNSYALPLSGGTLTGAVTFGAPVVFGSSGRGRIYADWTADTSTRSFFAGRNSTDTDWNWGAEFGWDGANQRWYFDTVPFIGGNAALHAGNYSGYALPIGGGTLTGLLTASYTTGGSGWTNIQIDAAPASGAAYIRANRATAATGEVGFVWATGGANKWINYLNVNADTLSWYQGSAVVMTLTTGGALSINGAFTAASASFSGALTSGGNAVLTVGNYSSYAVDNTKRVKQFFWDTISASTTQARRFEIARIAIDIVNWNQVGTFEIELSEQYWSNGLKKKYIVSYGYNSPRAVLKLVEMSGAGTNNFQVVLGSEQPVSGNHYYLPVYVDVRYYTYVDVRVTTSRQITANSTPPVGYTYINASPTPTNITDFGADSTVDISNAATAWQVGGNTIIHSGNYTSYPPARWATGRTISLTGDVTGTSGSFDGTANLSFSATLANSGVTAGTYRSVTVDAKGRVTSGTNPTTIAGYGITDALSTTGATMTGALNVTGVDQGLAIQHNGNTSAWFGRIVTKNSTSDRAAFLGTYGTIAGVFAHNNALNAWADLYINTVDGSGGGTVRMPSSVLVNGNQVIHTGNYVSYSPSLTGGGASGTWGINISGSSASCSGNAATATNASQLNGQAGSYYENRSPTAVSISAGTLTITRAAGNLTTTIGGRVVAWCDFNGNFASSQTPNANFNVSSITKNATGDYTVNFSSALANANYVVAGTAQLDTPSPGQSNYNVMVAVPRRSGAKATGSCRIVCEYPLGVALYDSISVGVAFIAA